MTSLAPFLTGVRVRDAGGSRVTAMAAQLLGDLGAEVVGGDADVVLAATSRAEAAPRVWVCVSPFGTDGPRARWHATDLGIVAASGNLYATGDPDRPPVRCAGDVSDAHGAPEIATAVVTALATGLGSVDVDLSLQETVTTANMGGAGRFFRTGHRGTRAGANVGRTREIWPCADGWVSFGLRGGPARVPSLTKIAELTGDPSLTERDWTAWNVETATDDELRRVEHAIGTWFATQKMADLYEMANETNVMLAPVNTPRELYASAQLAARQFFDPDTGAPRRWCHPRAGGSARPTVASGPRPDGGGAWAGTRIVELGAGAAGPLATRYFVEHGATVVRIESATRPDFLRAPQYSDLFGSLNCGKRSVALNLKHPDGKALARRLVAEWADAVLENYAPKALRGLGLTYDDLVTDRPDLVMVSACLNGQTGPHRDYPGFGGQGSALAGFNHLTGWPDREPVGPFGTITDSLAPRFVAFALGSAILHHRRTGIGAYVDVSQVECAVWTLAPWLARYRDDGVIVGRMGNAHPDAPVHGVFPSAGDDRWIAIACWSAAQAGRLRDLAGDDVAAWTATRTAGAAAAELQAAGIAAVPVQDFGDVHDDPQLTHRGHIVELPDGFHVERNGFRLSSGGAELPAGYQRPAPELGADTEWVLGELLGLGRDEQARLRDAGALA